MIKSYIEIVLKRKIKEERESKPGLELVRVGKVLDGDTYKWACGVLHIYIWYQS